MELTEITRLNLLDDLRLSRFSVYGAMGEIEFLSRLAPLDDLPSTDPRFRTMVGDITTHRISFSDWGDDWLWTDRRLRLDETDKFLECLCLMLHPITRRKPDEVEELRALFNRHLAHDGIEIVEAGQVQNRTTFAARPVGGGSRLADRKATLVTLGVHVAQQVERLRKTEEDPAAVIGAAKELMETVCKTVLRANNETYTVDDDLPRLSKKAVGLLKLVPDEFTEKAKAEQTLTRLMSNFSNIAHCMAELRNVAGTGHGKEATFNGLGAAYARLAADSAITFAAFVASASGLAQAPIAT